MSGQLQRWVYHTGLGRRAVRMKRYLVNRRGDGVHSPYAFHLISRIIRNPHPYYCFSELARYAPKSWQLGRRQAELAFRLVIGEGLVSVCLLSRGESPVAAYLEATSRSLRLSYNLPSASKPQPELILVEDAESLELKALIRTARAMRLEHHRSLILVHTHSPSGRRLLQTLLRELDPEAVIDLVDLSLLVLCPTLTRGRYKAYY